MPLLVPEFLGSARGVYYDCTSLAGGQFGENAALFPAERLARARACGDASCRLNVFEDCELLVHKVAGCAVPELWFGVTQSFLSKRPNFFSRET